MIFSFFVGKDGLWATEQLLSQKRYLSTHTANIEKTYEDLSIEKLALQSDLDVIAAYARKLGYIGQGEKLIKVSGLPTRDTQIYDPGTLKKHTEVKFIPDYICKLSGFFVFLLLLLIQILIDIKKGRLNLSFRKKQYVKIVNGTQVYDMY